MPAAPMSSKTPNPGVPGLHRRPCPCTTQLDPTTPPRRRCSLGTWHKDGQASKEKFVSDPETLCFLSGQINKSRYKNMHSEMRTFTFLQFDQGWISSFTFDQGWISYFLDQCSRVG